MTNSIASTKFQLFLCLFIAIGVSVIMISLSMTAILGKDLERRKREAEPREMQYKGIGISSASEPMMKSQQAPSIDLSRIDVATKRAARRMTPWDGAAAESLQLDDERMILVGGYNDGFRGVSRYIQFFNISSQEWSKDVLPLPYGVAETHQGIAYDRQNRVLYIVSGQLGTGCMPATPAAVRLFLDTKRFEFLPHLPLPRYAPGAIIVPARIGSTFQYLHIFGGASTHRNDSATDHWRLEIDNDRSVSFSKWETLEPVPDAGTHGTAFLASDGYFYYTAFCNLDPGMIESPSMADCHVHAAQANQQRLHHVSHAGLTYRYPTVLVEPEQRRAHWERVADIPFPVCHGGSLIHGGKLYIIGGSILTPQSPQGSAPVSWPTIQVFDPLRNEWQVTNFTLPPRKHLFLLSSWIDQGRRSIFSLHPNNALITIDLTHTLKHSHPSNATPSKALSEHYRQLTTPKAIDAFGKCFIQELGEKTRDVTMVTATDEQYNNVRGTWNQRNAHRQYPDIVLQPNSTHQVSVIVRCAKRTGYHLCGRNGRHSYDGTTCTNGIVVDVSRFQTAELINTERGHARLGAGLTLGQAVLALEVYGLALPAGSCSSVGLTGLTLNGGQGPLSRMYGMTSDHLVSVELVDERGDVVFATDTNEYSDLLWLARGGGAVAYHYPGIITGLGFSSLPQISRNETPWTRVRIQFLPATVPKAVQLLAAWQDWYHNDACRLDVFCRRITAEPWLFMQYRRRKQVYQPALRLVVYFFGNEEQHELFRAKYLPQFQNFVDGGTVVSSERVGQLEFHRRVGGLQSVEQLSLPYLGHDVNASWLGLSAVVGGQSLVSHRTFRAIAQTIFRREPRYRRYAEFKPLGGAIPEQDSLKSAFWHRNAHWWVLMNHFVNASDDVMEKHILDDFSVIISTLGESFQGQYAGYVQHGNSTARDLEMYYGGNADCIRKIKRNRDPHNLFRNYLPNRPRITHVDYHS